MRLLAAFHEAKGDFEKAMEIYLELIASAPADS